MKNLVSSPVDSILGDIRVPGDKSISHRAIIFGAIAEGITRVKGFLDGEDCLATLKAFRAMGVSIEGPVHQELVIHGVGKYGLKQAPGPIDCGNSGTSMRLLAGLLAAQAFDSELIGDESLMKRPMQRVSKPLAQMGANISTNEGLPPIIIRGGQSLKGIDYTMQEASAQVKSCILLAGLYAKGPTTIRQKAISRDHTERMLQSFSYPLIEQDYKLVIDSSHQCQAVEIQVPGDLSAAAFFIVAALIVPGSEVLIRDVGINPSRTGLIDILTAMGARIKLLNQRQFGAEPVADIEVQYAPLKGIQIPKDKVSLAIDEFPILFIAAACARGETLLHGAQELRFKESDRISVMVEGLNRLGIEAYALEDGARIIGGKIQGGTVDSHGDHRIAMSFAIAGTVATAPVTVLNSGPIATSFPSFVDTANKIHCRCQEIEEVPVITLDGPSGTGKGTLCHRLAKHLKWHFLDSGLIYRALAYAAYKKGLATDVLSKQLIDLAKNLDLHFGLSECNESQVFLDSEEVSLDLRQEAIGQKASEIAQLKEIRLALLERQRGFARLPGLVTDGRDMGTVVFPEASLKIFLYASSEERAKRRFLQLQGQGIRVSLAEVIEELQKRDARDESRLHAPLKAAKDAIQIDTSGLTVDQVFQNVLNLIHKRGIIDDFDGG